ncbi:MAG: AAA family ATPase, partial [Candidatus Nanoarchaeia archaeon]
MDEKVKIALEKQNPWWFDKSFPSGIDRPSYRAAILKYLRTPEILLLVGARRTGKSTLLYQTIHYILKKGKRDSVLFINLDEPLFQSKADDPAFLGDLIASCLAERPIKYVFIDEIQNYQYWAQMVKTLYDTQKDLKIILTGSSSTLIHSKLATRLSGRFFHVRVFPLSFSEYLNFNEIKK